MKHSKGFCLLILSSFFSHEGDGRLRSGDVGSLHPHGRWLPAAQPDPRGASLLWTCQIPAELSNPHHTGHPQLSLLPGQCTRQPHSGPSTSQGPSNGPHYCYEVSLQNAQHVLLCNAYLCLLITITVPQDPTAGQRSLAQDPGSPECTAQKKNGWHKRDDWTGKAPTFKLVFHRTYFMCTDGDFECLFWMIFLGYFASGASGAGQKAEGLRVRNNQDHTPAAFRWFNQIGDKYLSLFFYIQTKGQPMASKQHTV